MRTVLALVLFAGCSAPSTLLAQPPGRLGSVVEAGFVVPSPSAPPAWVRETLTVDTYPVTGATPSEVNASVRERSPFRNSAGRVESDAYTSWGLRWTFRTERDGTACRLRDVQVLLTLKTTIWDWTPPPGTTARAARRVREMRETLFDHERGHQDIARLGALDVADTLRDRSAPTCNQLSAEANAAGQEVLDALRVVNRAFDAVTESGTVLAPGAR